MNLSRENIYNLGDTDIFVVVDKDVVDIVHWQRLQDHSTLKCMCSGLKHEVPGDK